MPAHPGAGALSPSTCRLGRSATPTVTAKKFGAGADGHFPRTVSPTPVRDVARLKAGLAQPAHPATLAPGPLSRACLAHDPLVGTKVLVVDDDFRNSFSMTVLLKRVHAEVIVAESGPAALAALEQCPGIAIVLMDIMMPFMDGYETIRAIRALDAFKALPIIAVTGKVVPGEHQRCVEAGANDYVPKPVDMVELLDGHEAIPADDRRRLNCRRSEP